MLFPVFSSQSSQYFLFPCISYLCMFFIVFRLLVSTAVLLAIITLLVPGRIYCRFISIVVGFSWNTCSALLRCLFYLLFLHYLSLCTQSKLFLALIIPFFYFLLSFLLSLLYLLRVILFNKLDFYRRRSEASEGYVFMGG